MQSLEYQFCLLDRLWINNNRVRYPEFGWPATEIRWDLLQYAMLEVKEACPETLCLFPFFRIGKDNLQLSWLRCLQNSDLIVMMFQVSQLCLREDLNNTILDCYEFFSAVCFVWWAALRKHGGRESDVDTLTTELWLFPFPNELLGLWIYERGFRDRVFRGEAHTRDMLPAAFSISTHGHWNP